MKLIAILAASVGASVLLAAPACAQSEPGNLMNVTSTVKMQMTGMSVPPQTHTTQVCASAKKPDPREMLKQLKDCTISNFVQDGDSASYHMVCQGRMPMVGDARFAMHADGSTEGTVHSTSNAAGRAITMDMSIHGERVGSCQYTPKAG